MDVESQMKCDRPRVRCLDVFLVGSVVLLFLAFATVAVTGTMAVTEIQSKFVSQDYQPTPTDPVGKMNELRYDTPYKMQNFAYIQPNSSELVNLSTMSWQVIESGRTNSIGSLYAYNKNTSALQILMDGMYFVYLELNLTCTAICEPGTVTVHLNNDHQNPLTCEVVLPEWPKSEGQMPQTVVSKQCWVVTHLKSKSHLTSDMKVSKSEFWKLDLNKSRLGVLLVSSD